MVNKNNHPFLIWGSYSNITANSYKVYRSVNGGKYVLIATTNSSTFDYVDQNTAYSSANPVYYYVKAYNGTYSSATNIIGTPTSKKSNISDNNMSIEKEIEFNLFMNYPNPFNPSTNIIYQLPKKGHVVLKIYNTLGKEVAELINETKEEGTYSVTFNGENLPSGLYFYKIQIGEFVEVKKMLLLK